MKRKLALSLALLMAFSVVSVAAADSYDVVSDDAVASDTVSDSTDSEETSESADATSESTSEASESEVNESAEEAITSTVEEVVEATVNNNNLEVVEVENSSDISSSVIPVFPSTTPGNGNGNGGGNVTPPPSHPPTFFPPSTTPSRTIRPDRPRPNRGAARRRIARFDRPAVTTPAGPTLDVAHSIDGDTLVIEVTSTPDIRRLINAAVNNVVSFNLADFDITTVLINANTFGAFADAEVYVTFVLPQGSVTFCPEAIASIADQATGQVIITLDGDDVGVYTGGRGQNPRPISNFEGTATVS